IKIEDLVLQLPNSKSIHANKEFEMLFNFRIALLHFSKGEFQRSLKYVNSVINESGKDLRQDIYGHVRVLNVFVHHMLNNDDVVEYAIKSLIRFYKSKSDKYQDSVVFLKSIKSALKIKNGETKKSSNQRLLEIMPTPANIEDYYLMNSLRKGLSL
ncbi:MAG: hypothetical protein ACKO8Q_07475, partial [Bacteroidota bacterium]